MTYEDLIWEKRGGTAILTLNRPEKLNALSKNLKAELKEALEQARDDEEVRVLVITGSGRAFCTGVDLDETLAAYSGGEGQEYRARGLELASASRAIFRSVSTAHLAAP